MKKLYLLLVLILTLPVLAQVQNISVTDCTNNTKSIHGVLGSGKVLLVVSNGVDCSNCQNAAPGLQTFAMNYGTDIEVWGAMTYLYNQSATPACSDVNSWVNTYNWANIFAFRDANRYWFNSGTPRYYVYDPKDTSLAYEGFSEPSATNKALLLAGILEIKENKTTEPFSVSTGNGYIFLHNLPSSKIEVQLVNITGKMVKTVTLSNSEKFQKISAEGLHAGLYLINVKDNKGFKAVRKVLIR